MSSGELVLVAIAAEQKILADIARNSIESDVPKNITDAVSGDESAELQRLETSLITAMATRSAFTFLYFKEVFQVHETGGSISGTATRNVFQDIDNGMSITAVV